MFRHAAPRSQQSLSLKDPRSKENPESSTPLVQAKLIIGNRNDHFEAEAETMADKVIGKTSHLEPIQRKINNSGPPMQTASANEALAQELTQHRGRGNTLPEHTQTQMSDAFGVDFSKVRIHTGAAAIQMNRSLGARAFTQGRDIYFNQGEYEPEHTPGKHLLAHELTHVVQQGGANAGNNPIVQKSELPDTINIPEGGGNPKNWNKSDRVNRTQRWKDACLHNLLHLKSGEYTQIEQRRDFYRWFYESTAAKGYETRWALAAYIVAGGMGEMASVNWTEGASPITNELQGLARIGNQVIFDNVLPKLRALWRGGPVKGQAAIDSDAKILAEEQHLIAAMYAGLSKDTMERFQKIADNTYLRTTVGRQMGLGGNVKKGPYNKGGDVSDFSGMTGLVPGGDITKVKDRWKYGMALGAEFSTLKPSGTLGAMPKVGKAYSSGAEFKRLNVRPNLHKIDARLNDTDVVEKQVVRLLKKLNPREQRELNHDAWRINRLEKSLNLSEMLEGIQHLAGVRLLDKMTLLGGATNHDWNDIDYDQIKWMIKAAPLNQRKQLHDTGFWMKVFVEICTDKTITPATEDLGLPDWMAKQWIEAEL